MTRIGLVCLVLLAACHKKGDDCEQAFDKMARVMKDGPGGDKIVAAKGKFLDQCRKNHDQFLKDPAMKCVLDASSDSAVADCLKQSFHDYASASKKVEAELQLNAIGRKAKAVFMENGAFPTGTAKMLPAGNNGTESCCGGADGKCAVSHDWASDPVWSALGFSIDEPSLYRYTYESKDGKSFTATAVGDADCDGKPETYTTTGSIDASGNPTTSLPQPAGQH